MAAIRECREELNLDEKDISLIDYSSMILSSSNRLIKAYYGRINKNFENISYNMEVDSIFTVSIDYLKKNPPEKYTAKLKMDLPDDFPFEKIPNGKNYNFWQRYHTFYFYNTKPVIWGMTANVLKDFLKFYKYLVILTCFFPPKCLYYFFKLRILVIILRNKKSPHRSLRFCKDV